MEISWIEAIETIGVPAVGAGGLGYLVWVLFKSLITGVNKKLDTQQDMIVTLIDRVRQLDNDIIRKPNYLHLIIFTRIIDFIIFIKY